MKSSWAVSILIAPVLVACAATPSPADPPAAAATSAGQTAPPARTDLLEGRHTVDTLKGPEPRESSWLADNSYALHWDFTAGPRVEYSFTLRPEDGTSPVKSTVWLNKSCGSVDFSVKAQGNAIRYELTEFATDPKYTYEVRAELTFTAEGAATGPRESFTLTAAPEDPSNCDLYWGMFFPTKP